MYLQVRGGIVVVLAVVDIVALIVGLGGVVVVVLGGGVGVVLSGGVVFVLGGGVVVVLGGGVVVVLCSMQSTISLQM